MAIDELICDLEPVTRWFDLGLYLGVSEHYLHQLKSEQVCVDYKRVKVLVEWTENCHCPTWCQVVDALKQMDELQLANHVASKHGMIISINIV